MRNRANMPVRQIRPVLHIFCEGSKTEPNYIEHYKDLFCREKKASIVVEKTDKTTPVQLVETALQYKNSSYAGQNDEYWVVYDRESPVKYDEKFHQEARDKAKAGGVNIALSNVCFEVWLLMHFQPTCAACDTCDDLTGRKDFKKHFPQYEKGAECTYLPEQIMTARRNSEKLNKRTINAANKSWTVPSMWNPYTDVHMLLAAIDAFCAV